MKTAEDDFLELARALLASIVKLLEARGPQRVPAAAAETAAPPPDIPDAPATGAAPPAAPDVPDEPQSPQPTDAEFLAGLEGVLGQCANDAAVDKCAVDNAAEAAERGVEQAANDLIEQRRQRIREIRAGAANAAAKDEYVRIALAIKDIGAKGTLAHLQKLWAGQQRAMKMLPESWQAKLAAEKDRVKAQLQQKQGEAA